MLIYAAFTVLLILLEIEQSAQNVAIPPPSNLTITCQMAAAHWDYPDNNQVGFLVNVSHLDVNQQMEIPAHQRYANVSGFVWESLESALAVHSINVTARAPDGRLSDTLAVSFTYNDDRMANIKCKLEFPPVDVKAIEGGVAISFPNPLYYYPQVRRATRRNATRPDAISLHFFAKSHAGDVAIPCRNEERTCKGDVSLPTGDDKCVTVEGSAKSLAGRSVSFGPSPRTCAQTADRLAELVPGVVIAVVVALLVIVAVAIYRVRPRSEDAGAKEYPKCLHNVKSANNERYCNGSSLAEVDKRVMVVSLDEHSSGFSTEIESLQEEVQEEEKEILGAAEGVEEESNPVIDIWLDEYNPESNYDAQHVHMIVNMGDESAWGYAES
ncbi:interferon gamma receptor 1 [Stigmatopora argus]